MAGYKPAKTHYNVEIIVTSIIDPLDYVTGIGNMMTSPIDSNTFHGGTTGACNCNPRRLALWASTRVCVGAVAS